MQTVTKPVSYDIDCVRVRRLHQHFKLFWMSQLTIVKIIQLRSSLDQECSSDSQYRTH